EPRISMAERLQKQTYGSYTVMPYGHTLQAKTATRRAEAASLCHNSLLWHSDCNVRSHGVAVHMLSKSWCTNGICRLDVSGMVYRAFAP
ncbi:hypothetical protein BaRGS_00036512, partial [Batillaria attramentaria]